MAKSFRFKANGSSDIRYKKGNARTPKQKWAATKRRKS